MGFTAQLLAEYTGATFVAELGNVLVAIFAVVEVLMILYAVYICYLFATATDESKRKNARNRLIKVISSCLIIFAFALALRAVDINFTTVKTDNDEGGEDINFGVVLAYTDSPGISISSNETTTIILSPAYLMLNATEVPVGAKFKSFVLAEDVGKLGLYKNFELNDDGSLIYTYKCYPSFSSNVVGEHVIVDVYNKVGDNTTEYVWGTATVEFQEAEYEILIWLRLDRCTAPKKNMS